MLHGVRQGIEWARRVVTRPGDELTRWERAARHAYQLGRHGARMLREDRAPQMAAALAFRTLFGLLPVLVVGTILVKAIGGFGAFEHQAARVFASLGLDAIRMESASGGVGPTLSEWLLGFVAQARDVDLTAITWVGVAVLCYSALSLMVTIESAFNGVFRAPEGRPWLVRLPIYWTVLTLGPAALGGSVYLGERLDRYLASEDGWRTALRAATVAWGFAVTWLVMTALYKWVPHASVGFRPALAGAFVAAAGLEAGKRSLGAYLDNALSIRQLYGSLGLIPLFMFWVYLAWLMVLFGLEVAAALQLLGGRSLGELETMRSPGRLVEPACVVAVVRVIAERFERSRPTLPSDIVEETGLPEEAVVTMLGRLTEAGILHSLGRDDGAVALARPPEAVDARRLLDVGFELTAPVGPASQFLERLRRAQREAVEGLTLRALVGGDPSTTDARA